MENSDTDFSKLNEFHGKYHIKKQSSVTQFVLFVYPYHHKTRSRCEIDTNPCKYVLFALFLANPIDIHIIYMSVPFVCVIIELDVADLIHWFSSTSTD